MSNRMRLLRRRLPLVLLLLAAFALRVYRLEVQSLWWDEGISLHLATSTLPQIVTDRVVNIHPPLYFILLKGWVSIVGVTPFAARYSSVVASLLQVAAVYGVTRRWWGRQAPAAVWLATLLTAFSPLSVIYGQETRVYALLPLIYLALLAALHALSRLTAVSRRAPWVGLGVAAWLGLHLHYIAAFMIGYVGVWLLVIFVRRRHWSALRRLVVTGTAVGAASMPWFLAVLLNRITVQERISSGTYLTEPVPIPFLLSQVWTFHLTGLAGILARIEIRVLAVAVALLLIAVAAWRLRTKATRQPVAAATAHWLLPLAATLAIWSVRSFSHPRYVSIFALGLLLLLAVTIAPRWPVATQRHRWIWVPAGLLAAAVVAIFALGLHTYFFDPAVAKQDMRAVARYLEARAGADDLILIPDSDWSLPFEFAGETPIAMPQTEAREIMWSHLAQQIDGRERLFMVDYRTPTRDWQQVAEFVAEQAGTLVQSERFDELIVRTYRVEGAVQPPDMRPVNGRFGPLRLTGVWIESSVAADSAVTVALRWQLDGSVSQRFRTTVRLRDSEGWTVAQQADVLIDENGRPTEEWPPGHTATTYHLVPIVPGTPPLTYTVTADVFAAAETGVQMLELIDETGAPQGQQLPVGDTTLRPAQRFGANPYRVPDDLPRLPQPLPILPGVELLAVAPDRDAVGLGQSLFVTLLWQATASEIEERPLPLALVQGEQVLVADEGGLTAERYPPHRWQAGEWVRETRQLIVPPGSGGAAQLALLLPEGNIPLGEVTIRAGEQSFAPPPVQSPLDVAFGGVARLVGYDLVGTQFATDEPVPLTLYWQSLVTGTERPYVVFTHLLDGNGRLIGQHDAPPVNGQRPTTGWVANEYLRDVHPMAFRDPTYAGPARIQVGLYDPETGTRLLTEDGADHVLLPVTLTIAP